MSHRTVLCLLMLCAASACGGRPTITTQESAHVAQAAYPQLAPIDALLAATPQGESAVEKAEREVAARAARLRARAAALRQKDI